jgi:hypothetical protein
MGIFQGRSKGSWFGVMANAGLGHGGPKGIFWMTTVATVAVSWRAANGCCECYWAVRRNLFGV